MHMDCYDLVVIGAGWAGINAALKAASLGLKVALFEKDNLGGVCLNYGCIPTKYLIHYAKLYLKSKIFLKQKTEAELDLKKLKTKKDVLIERLRLGLSVTLKNRNITYIESPIRFVSDFELEAKNFNLKAKNIIIATGSRAKRLDFLEFDGKRIISSNEAVELEYIPASILIIGAGVIGCEFASLFNLLGSKVTLVEILPQILPKEDLEMSNHLAEIFKRRGINIYTSTDARKMPLNSYELILISVGRIPNTEELGLENTNIELKEGRIVTDDYLSTTQKGVYAAGDCTNRLMFAHLAAYQGVHIVENIVSGKRKKINPICIPSCIFTYPELARVGMTEEEAKAKNIKFNIHRLDFRSLGMSYVLEETEGIIKIISEKKRGTILGASILGPYANEIIAILTLAIQKQIRISEFRSVIFGHPTISECITEVLK